PAPSRLSLHDALPIWVIPESMVARELAHTGLTQLQVVPGMHARKARMAELADAFIALPGGYGTFEELFEVITWAQLGMHRKPIGDRKSTRLNSSHVAT